MQYFICLKSPPQPLPTCLPSGTARGEGQLRKWWLAPGEGCSLLCLRMKALCLFNHVFARLHNHRCFILILIIVALSFTALPAQEKNYTIVLDRGRLWHAFDYAQECQPMADWQRKTYGLDWPGYNTEELPTEIGGSHSYLVSGGFYVMAKTDTGTVWGWDDFAVNARGNVEWTGDNYRYLVKKHEKRWKNGENYWLAQIPNEAEEIIDTYWEYNPKWFRDWDNQKMPISVTRTVRQWSGSQADEDYIIVEYKIKNEHAEWIGRDLVPLPLKGVYLLFTYALSPNHRGWNLLFPNLTSGARNTHSTYDPKTRTLLAQAGDFLDTPVGNEAFDYFLHTRYDPIEDVFDTESEFVAPAKMGIKFLHISADSTGIENHVNGFVWSAAPPSGDHSGPFLGVAGLNNKYDAMVDPFLLSEAFDDPNDSRMGKSRLYANWSLGPYNMEPNDSITVVVAEFVGGMSYAEATDPKSTRADVDVAVDSAAQYLSGRVNFNYEHDYTVPVPPPPPQFSVSSIDSGGVVANVISFGGESENVNDPHQGTPDLAGYRIYRSWNYPFGPWIEIADIPKGDPRYFDNTAGAYTFIDYKVALGFGYYYSLTAYDTGHESWQVDPSVTVPSLESSIFANRKKQAFNTTQLPTERRLDEVTVVPNPFYRHSGLQKAGDENRIQFVNLSERCTIRIYTLRGDLVKKIEHNDPGSGVAYWNQISDNGQYVKSGMYFYHIKNEQGDVKKGKFAIIK